MKKIIFLVLFFLSIFIVPITFAQENSFISEGKNSFISIVNPIRGDDFWNIENQDPKNAVLGQIAMLKNRNLSATWLLRFDALNNNDIIEAIRNRQFDEKGLFLEITPTWASQSSVQYRKSESWHAAGSAFLTGYERSEREKLIDTAFEKFKSVFGYWPVSVGAWWIDSYSLVYMQKKYDITSALIVSDQYSTDNYQIWGQYFGTPYYPTKNNVLHPAQSIENKLPIVMMQWAPRDPVNAYGNGVSESTFSMQANDYIDYHNLDTKYFSKLIDIYTKQKFNQFAHVIVGLENSYKWDKYSAEYGKQMDIIAQKRNWDHLLVVTMKDFAAWYRVAFPKISPTQIIVADDPLGSFKKVVWFMNPFYRVAWFINLDGSVIRDIRQYIEGEEELCLKTRCDNVNFATSAIRVLDDVSFGHKWMIDQGKVSDIQVTKVGEEFLISYINAAGNVRKIRFLQRDISIDEKIFSIDSAILFATKQDNIKPQQNTASDGFLKWSGLSVLSKIIEFLTFLILVITFPGLILTEKLFKGVPLLLRLFISSAVGMVLLTVLFYIFSLLNLRPLIFGYILLSAVLAIRLKLYKNLHPPKIQDRYSLITMLIILAGVIFQTLPVFKSSLSFSYGIGFWGPNTHDGVWHIALINELIKSVPPENPIYSGIILKNYHFFYDLLIAATNYLSGLPVLDLVFRFYPTLFSFMSGLGSYYLFFRLFGKNNHERKLQVAAIFSLYLIYFAGSFGWIVEFLRERHIGGESAFWANQAVSFNLNPPFAISLVIIIALFHILFNLTQPFRLRNFSLAILLAGSLLGFKSYGAVLTLLAILFIGLVRRQSTYILIFIGATLISILIFMSNFDITSSLLVFAPFWFIHSMIDSPDRVGWVRLSLAREVGFATRNWFKFISAEALSLVIFIAGNLGLRIISLLLLVKIKNIFKNEKLFLIFIFAAISFLIPILFIQSGNPWNTIQFSYYGLYIASLVSGAVLFAVAKLPKYIAILVIITILVLAPINSIVTANSYLGKNPHAFISAKELQGLQFLSNQPDGVVLTFPYDDKLKRKLAEPWPILAYDSTAYVAALSKKSVYLEDEPQNKILLTDYKKRLVASKDFFLKPTSEGLKFLNDSDIKYVYIPKIFNVRLDESITKVKNIFENDAVVIYKINL